MPPPSQAVLLVDGYNIIGAWQSLQKRLGCDGLEAARRELVESLINYSAFQSFDTQVVFDAQYRDRRGDSRSLTYGDRTVETENLSIYYTDFGQTADTYIEKACSLFRNDLRKFQQRLIVATSDRAQQLTVVGYGAEWMSAQQLAFEVDSTLRRVNRRQRSVKKSSSRFLASSLDPAAQQRLAEWRKGL